MSIEEIAVYLIEVEDPKKKATWLRSAKRGTVDEAEALCEYLRAQGFIARYRAIK